MGISNLGKTIRLLLEKEFYDQCADRLDMDRDEVQERINKAQKAETSEEEKLTGVDDIYQIWGGIIESVNPELRFHVNGSLWSKLEIQQG